MRTALQERGGKTALLVIDVQNAVVTDGWNRDGVITRIGRVIDAAREGGIPVIYIQHDEPGEGEMEIGSEGWRIHASVAPDDGEPIVAKQHGDAFVDTTLEATLAERGIGHLVVTGAQSDGCVRSTCYGALSAGYDITLVSDAHTTSDRPNGNGIIPAELIVAHVNLANQFIDYPNTHSQVISHTEIVGEPAPVLAG
ncbi:MAG: cysteine hydrolase [Chloroflexota bacterium]|nr:cysteine hydrolase [Chloroflexota bacterium]